MDSRSLLQPFAARLVLVRYTGKGWFEESGALRRLMCQKAAMSRLRQLDLSGTVDC